MVVPPHEAPDGRGRNRSAIGSEITGFVAIVVECIQIGTSRGESFHHFLVALARGVVQGSLAVPIPCVYLKSGLQ